MLATAKESDKKRLLRLFDEVKIAPFRTGTTGKVTTPGA
jgi:hypothetical protein